MNVLLVKPGEMPVTAEIDGSLRSMQDLVGGLIEAIYPFEDPVALICNEEGKLQGMALNRALFHPETGQIYDIIAGPFFLCGIGEWDFQSLEQDASEKYEAMFHYPELFLPG